MKELRKKLTALLRSGEKYSLRQLTEYSSEAIGLSLSEEDILDSFFDILIHEINSYNFKHSPDKISYIFRMFKLFNKHIHFMKNEFYIDEFSERVLELEKVIKSKEKKSIQVQKGSHKNKVDDFFTRLKNEIVLLKVQLNIKPEEEHNLGVSNKELEEFLKYIVLNIKNYTYVEILYKEHPELMNFKNTGDKYLLDLVLTKYMEALMESNDNDAIYFERVVNLFIESDSFVMSDDYKKSLVKRLSIFLTNLDYSNEKDRLKRKAHLFIESTIENLNNVEHTYCEEEIKKLNSKFGIISKEKAVCPTAPYKDIDCVDMTDRHVITIDGDNTSCYDDAISMDVLPNGNYRVGIYIADVADFIRRPSGLDYFAYKQGNSIYLPNNVIPMFPNRLSTNICSLISHEYRHVLAFTFEFDKNFNLIKDDINRAIVKVRKNYGTTEVDKILERKENIEEYELLKKIIAFSEYLAAKNSSVKDYHKIKELTKGTSADYEDSIGYSALSQYMVFVNNFIAKRFDRERKPFIYRINSSSYNTHELEELKKKISLNPTLEDIMVHVQGMYTPSLYSTVNLGHKGLNLDAYAHTTNPIRNYASLTNQRIILDLLVDKDYSKEDEWRSTLPTIVEDLNASKDKVEEYRKEYCKIFFNNKCK